MTRGSTDGDVSIRSHCCHIASARVLFTNFCGQKINDFVYTVKGRGRSGISTRIFAYRARSSETWLGCLFDLRPPRREID
jgi:hypothetical protein